MSDAASLAPLAVEYHDLRQRTSPSFAHIEGDYRFADTFEDMSRAGEDREIADDRDIAARARSFPDGSLSPDEAISRDMIVFDALSRADLAEARLAELGADPIFGLQVALGLLIPKMPLPTAAIARAMIPKYGAIARAFDDLSARLRDGLVSGRVPAAFAVAACVEQIDDWLDLPIGDDPLLSVAEPVGLDDPDAWRADLERLVGTAIRPAAARHRDVLRDEVLPVARSDERCGLAWLRDGADAYARSTRFYTTVDLSPAEIHEIGLRQIDALGTEYRALGPEVVGSDDLATIFDRLRHDPSLRHSTGDGVVAASREALDKARAAMGGWFGRLPRADCNVEATVNGAQAFYFPPAVDGSRPGVFFMNTANPSDWARYQIESTSYHEGIPGHHLQAAIAIELDGIPEFRKRAFIPAHGEGWGLYAERLADEMGLYSSPLDRIGMLSADSTRACRLVVDTGLHAFGWSRDRAVEFMVANSAMPEGHVRAEVDRYVVTPGQALAYMIGRLEIDRMRATAEERLGDRFDVRAFHDAVIGSGLMPLPILDRHVAAWLSARA